MLLSDLSSLRYVARPQGNPQDHFLSLASSGPKAIDTGDPEIDRMYNQSPVITEFAATYQPDVYKTDGDKDDTNKTENGHENNKEKMFSKRYFKGKSNEWKSETYFAPKPINIQEIQKSGLTLQFEELFEKQKQNKGNAGKIKFTVYLPNTESLTVYAPKKSTFGQFIELILKEHQDQELRPSLMYDQPGMYEIRMHEGDGEPDLDLPAIPSDRMLRDVDLEGECCLCEVEREDSDFGPSATKNARNFSINDSLFSPSQFGAIGNSRNTSTKNSAGNLLALDNYTAVNPDRFSPAYNNNNDDDDDYNPNKFADEDDTFLDSAKEDSVTIRLPNGQEVNVPITVDSTFRDILPKIAKAHKLRIHTDEYVFMMSASDMKHFKYMFPHMEVSMKISATPCRVFEIQKKTYADSTKRTTKPNATTNATANTTNGSQFTSSNATVTNTPSNPLTAMITAFTETAANAYQEWNVVKKNKFGRKQERVFGVDGKKVYNAKRGQLKGGNQGGVQRAERYISNIIKIDIIADEHCPPATSSNTSSINNNASNLIGVSRTFRITWADQNDIYNIEYTCDTSRECIEIVAKIKYIMGRLKNEKRH